MALRLQAIASEVVNPDGIDITLEDIGGLDSIIKSLVCDKPRVLLFVLVHHSTIGLTVANVSPKSSCSCHAGRQHYPAAQAARAVPQPPPAADQGCTAVRAAWHWQDNAGQGTGKRVWRHFHQHPRQVSLAVSHLQPLTAVICITQSR
jgi:hypothetical protein